MTAGRLELHNDNRLKLGLFGANCSSGRTPTTVPERWSGAWDDTLPMAQLADRAGIDFLLPIGRWKGYGGSTDFNGTTLESLTWATAMLACTQRITVLATVHVPLLHPVVACKQMVTADQVGHGRFGLNIVCGWNPDELGMFAGRPHEHAQRYGYAQEWIEVVKRLWDGEDYFDYDGEFLHLQGLISKPRPYGDTRPVLFNAGASADGRAFAATNCDVLLSTPAQAKLEGDDPFATLVGEVDRLGADHGRTLQTYTVGLVCCRPSAQEARDYFQHAAVDAADTSALDLMIEARAGKPLDEIPEPQLAELRSSLALGWGGHPLIGSPDDVAEGLAALSRSGIRGVALSIVNYGEELPFFCDEVLPRLERLGVRVPVTAA